MTNRGLSTKYVQLHGAAGAGSHVPAKPAANRARSIRGHELLSRCGVEGDREMEWNLSRQFGRFRLRPLQTEDREIEDVRAGQQAAAGPGSAGLVVVGLVLLELPKT